LPKRLRLVAEPDRRKPQELVRYRLIWRSIECRLPGAIVVLGTCRGF